ncbi:hypothetical protein Sulku_1682 [Sulfuricurvum kujiense DSM 16994]|uniref:Helix-turn-helix domain-containing protein n=1 Tax=Sulfuricurvum kujiense (strain ATCC BAA-921 / DSM 16994 / JCM 11577 / YK-1) TaxID=709032 RepID=E4U0M6_SULKY|nr:helix-turn-helix domain-containing protein [Sulfuricurvum kujiense]ADR34343.1 hypothetical protein Sulku_1682 [Sulfuricurvum kujiense DSM 16994]
MSNKMITAAWDVPLPAYARLVLIALADSASEDEGVCWISNRTIMDKACASKSTVGYILSAFERLGIATRETRFEARKNGAQTSSIKRISIPVFSGTVKEIKEAKARFAAEYDAAYAWARSRKDTPSQEEVGEGCHVVDAPPTTQGGISRPTVCGTPHTTQGGTLEPSCEPSCEPPSSSSLPPQTECEDELCEGIALDSSFVLPNALSHLSIASIEDIVKKMSENPRINNPSRYKVTILEKIRKGDAETIENILTAANRTQSMNHIDKRKLGELRSEISARIKIMNQHGEPIKLILEEITLLIAPYVKTYSREELEKIIREELYMAGIEGFV